MYLFLIQLLWNSGSQSLLYEDELINPWGFRIPAQIKPHNLGLCMED